MKIGTSDFIATRHGEMLEVQPLKSEQINVLKSFSIWCGLFNRRLLPFLFEPQNERIRAALQRLVAQGNEFVVCFVRMSCFLIWQRLFLSRGFMLRDAGRQVGLLRKQDVSLKDLWFFLKQSGVAVVLLASIISVEATDLVPFQSSYKYKKGTTEASISDITAWRKSNFDVSSWLSGREPFYYDLDVQSSSAYSGNTLLDDMRNNYSCVFMRHDFVVSNPNQVKELQLVSRCDDGFIAWVNGYEVGRFNMPNGTIMYDGFASGPLNEPVPWYSNILTNAKSFLVAGTNTFAIQVFNNAVSSSDLLMTAALTGTLTPYIVFAYPTNGNVVGSLATVEVAFNESVSGVKASDLQVNGVSATNVITITPSQYLFYFAPPNPGIVTIAWTANQKIYGSSSNLFSGGSWSCELDPKVVNHSVVISEFMASNNGKQTNSVTDELGNHPDWIELYNSQDTSISLTGWALTDDPSVPTKWVFPATLIPAHGYLVVYASGRDTNVNGQLHSNFKLSTSPGYLGLMDTAGNIISEFATYPQQYANVSYGRDKMDSTIAGYYTNATPGYANSSAGLGFGPEVLFSRLGGTFQNNFNLTLSCLDTNFEIRYIQVTDNVATESVAITNIPTTNSLLYTKPITITGPVEIRARTFPKTANLFPGPPHTECYAKISSDAATFTSDMPIILLHNLGGGCIPGGSKQSVIAMTFEPVNGKASMTNPPTLVTRAGIKTRGSSTAMEPQVSLTFEAWDEYNADKDVSFLGMPEQSDWIFYGQNEFDTSYLHNPFIHQLSRDIGRYSPRTRYAEVFINTTGGTVTFVDPAFGNYYGLYTIEEKIKRDKNRVDITKLEPQITNSPDITGGYLLKHDRGDGDEAWFYDNYINDNLVLLEPGGEEVYSAARAPQFDYITSYFSDFGKALASDNYTNPITGYAAYIDVDTWIDHHMLNLLAFNVDGISLSEYMYKERNEKLKLGPLWDFDRTMGSSDIRAFSPRRRMQSEGNSGNDYFGTPDLIVIRWWQRLFSDPDFWQKWIDRWTELRRSQFSTNHINGIIDGFSVQIQNAAIREAARWGYNRPRTGYASAYDYSYTFNGTSSGEAAFLKQWFADRVDFIDTNFLRPPVFSVNPGSVAYGTKVVITARTIEKNTTTYYTLDGTDPRLPGGAVSAHAKSSTRSITLMLTNNVRIFARNWNDVHLHNPRGTVDSNLLFSSCWSGPTAATYVVSKPALAVTELMYSPGPYGTNDDEDYEFMELKNIGSHGINLVGMHFTNGIEFVFSATNKVTSLPAGAYMIVASNPKALLQRYPNLANTLIYGPYTGHFNNDGERITLLGPMEETILDFTYDNQWYPITSGKGFSLVVRNEIITNDMNVASSWRVSSLEGGSPGVSDPAPADIPHIVVNELLSHGDSSEIDYVELYNPTATNANIGGWFLTDNDSIPMKYCISTGTIVPAGQYIVFTEKQFNAGNDGSFAFSAQGEEVYLYSGNGSALTGYRHGFKFGPQVKSATFGRHVTSDGREHFVTQKNPSPGFSNRGPKVGPVVISEIMYAPPAFGLSADNLDEFIELRNISNQTVPLFDPEHITNTWSIAGAVEYQFPTNTSLKPQGYALLVHFDPVQDAIMLNWFRSRYHVNADIPIYGPWIGNLDNQGEEIDLYMPDIPTSSGTVSQVLVEEVTYSNTTPWPTNTDETGYSLQRIACGAYGDDPINWKGASPTAGTINDGAWCICSANAGLPDEWKLKYGLDPLGSEGDSSPTADPDGDGMNNLQEYIAGTSPIDANDYLSFDIVTATNNTIIMQFPMRAGRAYSIERQDELNANKPWVAIFTTNSVEDAPCVLTDTLNNTNRFYRIKVTKP